MKKTKKRFIRCPECGHYTRFHKKETSPLFGLLLFWIKSSGDKRPPCGNCGNNKKNFTHVFLETEVGENGNEVAYYTPKGERKELR